MIINLIGLSFQEKINHEDAIQSSHSTGGGNSYVTTKINLSSADGFDAFMSPCSKKSSNSYVSKSVLECQMSKTVVCDKEPNVNDVKDIYIDEGVSSLGNFFNRSKEEKSIYKILPPNQNEGSVKEQMNYSEVFKSMIPDAKTICLEDHFAMGWSTHHNDAKNLKQIEEAKLDLSGPQVSVEKLVRKSHSSESLDNIYVEITGEKANSKNPATASKCIESCNGNSTDLDYVAESPNDNIPTHASDFNHEFENESIRLNFNSISLVSNDGEVHKVITNSSGNKDSAIGTQVSTDLEFRTSDSRLVPIQSLHDIGESSFSAVDPLASLVTYSRPIAYSGSVSIRSESSTTSTHSLAFPIVQSKWNTSPVKMVKVERRHYRKYRGWREGLLCCKF